MAAVLGIIAMPALAQTHAATGTGARPGNVVGTGSSLPRSGNAGTITARDTHSAIAPNRLSPPIGETATAHNYLSSARAALVAAHTGEARHALDSGNRTHAMQITNGALLL